MCEINQVPYSSVVLPTLIPSPRLLDEHSRLPHLQEVRSDDRKWTFGWTFQFSWIWKTGRRFLRPTCPWNLEPPSGWGWPCPWWPCLSRSPAACRGDPTQRNKMHTRSSGWFLRDSDQLQVCSQQPCHHAHSNINKYHDNTSNSGQDISVCKC